MKHLLTLIALCFFATSQSFAQAPETASTDDQISQILYLENAIASLDEDHCEVPCGIYGDSLRVALIMEHITTIEKAMNQINKLSKEGSTNYNQLIRWVMNKEKHAEEIQHIVSQYFLHQRVKMLTDDSGRKAEKKYHEQLSTLHTVLVYAMKTKQTTDLANIEKIRAAMHDFEHAYFGEH